MREHTVDFSIRRSALHISKADVAFTVKYENKVLGKCLISRGAVVWVPRGKQKGHRLSWQKFDEMMRKVPATKHKQT